MFSKKKLLSTQEYGFDVSLFLGFLKGVLFIFLKIILWKLLFFKNLIFGLRIILTCITLYTYYVLKIIDEINKTFISY